MRDETLAGLATNLKLNLQAEACRRQECVVLEVLPTLTHEHGLFPLPRVPAQINPRRKLLGLVKQLALPTVGTSLHYKQRLPTTRLTYIPLLTNVQHLLSWLLLYEVTTNKAARRKKASCTRPTTQPSP